MLLTSQASTDGDEAVVGTMAKHVLENGQHPFFFYGQDYGGGASIEAHFAAVSFALFGISSTSFKSVGLVISMALLLLSYFFIRRYYGAGAAAICSTLLVFSPTFIEWNLKVRGGHILALIFSLVLCHFFFKSTDPDGVEGTNQKDKGRREILYPFLFGLTAGLAYWNLPVAAVLLITLFILWAYQDYFFFLRKRFFIFCTGAVTGLAPFFAHALSHQLEFPGFILSKRVTSFNFSPSHILDSLFELIQYDGPSFFTPYLDQSAIHYYGKIPVYAWFLFAISVLAVVRLTIKCCKREKSAVCSAEKKTAERVISFYIIFYLIIYLCQSGIAGNPRYLLPLEPFLTLATALFYLELLKHPKIILRRVGLFFLTVQIIIGISIHGLWLQKPAQFISAGAVSTPFLQETISKTIRYLDQEKIRYVYTPDHLLEWKIIFDSKERIIASRLDPSHRYLPYLREINRAVVKEGVSYAIVFPNSDEKYSLSTLKKVLTFLNKERLQYERTDIDNVIILHGISQRVFGVLPGPEGLS